MKDHEDMRVQKTKEKLQNALMTLMEEKPFSEISVSELCKYANVSRQTFYSNYQAIEDVFLEKLDELMNHFYEIKPADAGIETTFYYLSIVFLDNRDFLQKLYRANLDAYILHKFEETLKNISRKYQLLEDVDWVNTFLAGGMYNILRHWLMMKSPISTEELTDIMAQICRPILRGWEDHLKN